MGGPRGRTVALALLVRHPDAGGRGGPRPVCGARIEGFRARVRSGAVGGDGCCRELGDAADPNRLILHQFVCNFRSRIARWGNPQAVSRGRCRFTASTRIPGAWMSR